MEVSFSCLNKAFKAVLRNQCGTEQRPADETAVRAVKYYPPLQGTTVGH